MKVEHLIRNDYVIANPYAGLHSVKKQLSENKAVVVIDKGRYVGIITHKDISNTPKTLIIDNISDKPEISRECSIEDALSLMNKSDTNALPVLNNKKLIGLVFKKDLVNYISEYNLELEKKIKNSTQELQHTIAMKDMMFSIIAHDLRSPFNSIVGFTDILINQFDSYSTDQIANQIADVNNHAKIACNLLDDLLTWAGSHSGIIEHKPVVCNIEKISKGVIQQLSGSAILKKITLNSFHSGENSAIADKNMIESILRNLISNAIKFTEKGGKVDIYSIATNDFIEVTISDNGIGISAKNQNKLFKSGQAVLKTGTSGEKGLGFGLLICKEFVEQNKGKLWVVENKEKGTEFKFTLPRY